MRRKDRHLRILLADDHELVRRGIRGLLRVQRGWRIVAESATGREAVERARRLRPHIAIIDIAMPDMDGLEATRQIRDVAPDARVLILSMHDSNQMVRRVMETGARGYVLKSDLEGHLVRAIKAVAQGKIYLTPKVSEIVLAGFIDSGTESGRTERPDTRLTARQREITRLLAEGKANKEVAAAMGITVRTAETHRAKIMLKLGVHSLSELIHYAIRNEIVRA
ncbi:MAG TPA: response regulator transcription factor [Candidatus Acidoferrales bacterium]|nr:response regulator transcription factor [Candidatus Acidoferrales bacterium]